MTDLADKISDKLTILPHSDVEAIYSTCLAMSDPIPTDRRSKRRPMARMPSVHTDVPNASEAYRDFRRRLRAPAKLARMPKEQPIGLTIGLDPNAERVIDAWSRTRTELSRAELVLQSIEQLCSKMGHLADIHAAIATEIKCWRNRRRWIMG